MAGSRELSIALVIASIQAQEPHVVTAAVKKISDDSIAREKVPARFGCQQGILELPRSIRASVRKYISFFSNPADVACTDSSSESEDDVPDLVSSDGNSSSEDSEYDSDIWRDGERDTEVIDVQNVFVVNRYLEDDSGSTAELETGSNDAATDTNNLQHSPLGHLGKLIDMQNVIQKGIISPVIVNKNDSDPFSKGIFDTPFVRV